MSVWLTIPSARPPAEVEPVLKAWRQQGYRVALWRDWNAEPVSRLVDLVRPGVYSGYASAVNSLVAEVMDVDAAAEWFIAAGDDIWPDINWRAEEIAQQCRYHFEDLNQGNAKLETFGVMQPTGDRGFGDAQGPYIDRVAGSAWIGREFARRMYGGKGPLWPEYTHQFVDQELQEVAVKLGVFWQRPDLTHLHQHWGRPREGERMGQASRMPEFLKEANSAAHWIKFKQLFEQRKALGFPGHEPI